MLGTLLFHSGIIWADKPIGRKKLSQGPQADCGTMAKLVECVPNFSEGNNKEVSEHAEGLQGG